MAATLYKYPQLSAITVPRPLCVSMSGDIAEDG